VTLALFINVLIIIIIINPSSLNYSVVK